MRGEHDGVCAGEEEPDALRVGRDRHWKGTAHGGRTRAVEQPKGGPEDKGGGRRWRHRCGRGKAWQKRKKDQQDQVGPWARPSETLSTPYEAVSFDMKEGNNLTRLRIHVEHIP
jgi:hypothetical protein